MGAVYEVVHSETQRRCVLKTMLGSLLTDPEMRARFRLEATVTANIESDHIVDIYDAGFDENTGLPFLVMEYLRGETLANRLQTSGPLPTDEALVLLRQASMALDRTHAAGIIHRDLKPENLFIARRDDGSPSLKLLDFGIAKIVAQSANVSTTRSFGTPLYMSPEQIRGDGDIDGRADLYALGQIAYKVLTGHAYFEPELGDKSSVYPLLLKVIQGITVPASERARAYGVSLPAGFDSWFARATHADTDQRFDTATEQIAELSSVLVASCEKDVSTLTRSAGTASSANADLTSPPGGAPITLTGASRTGVHTLGDSKEHAPRRWRIAAWLALGFAGAAGFAHLWFRSSPTQSQLASNADPSVTPVSRGAPSGQVPREASTREAELATLVGGASSAEVVSAGSSSARSATVRLSRPPARERTPSAKAVRASVRPDTASPEASRGQAPDSPPYDPSDVR